MDLPKLITITFTNLTPQRAKELIELHEQLERQELAGVKMELVSEPNTPEEMETKAEEPKRGRGRPKKVKVEEPEEEQDEESVEEVNEDDGLDDDDDDGLADEEDEAPALQLEDVRAALKTYVGANKNGERERVVNALQKKFGVKNINNVDPKHYPEVLKMIGKRK